MSSVESHNCGGPLTALIMLAASCLSLPTHALAADPDTRTMKSVLAEKDRDGNGRIEDDEWNEIPQIVRSRLSEAERENQIEWSDVARPDRMAKAFRDRMVYVFDYYDRDDDGRINPDEARRIDGKHRSVISEIDLSRSITRNRFVDYYCRIAVGLPPRLERVRQRVTLDLPDAYVLMDLDEDGQIGYYEWPRRERLEFFFLDVNEDGFLTPRELAVDEEDSDDDESDDE